MLNGARSYTGPQTDGHTDKLRNKPLNQLNVASNFGENISLTARRLLEVRSCLREINFKCRKNLT